MPSSTAASRRVLRVAIAWIPSSTVPSVTCITMCNSRDARHQLSDSTHHQLQTCATAAHACCTPHRWSTHPHHRINCTACMHPMLEMTGSHSVLVQLNDTEDEHRGRAHQAVHGHGLRLAQPVAAVLEAPATHLRKHTGNGSA